MTWEGLSPPYSTIVADPPWCSLGGGWKVPTRVGRVVKSQAPEANYSTMSAEQVAAFPVGELASPDAHLYLWVVNSGLREGVDVMDAWGFQHKTTLTWIKGGNIGLGYWFRNQTEHVLFGVRGSLRTLDREQRTFFHARKRGHSVKPAAFGDLVERCSPGPYVELFARAPRLGWDSWGKGYEVAS